MRKALAVLFLLAVFAAACTARDSSSAGSGSQPTRTKTPTVTLTPTPSPAEILAQAGDAMLAMDSARFLLIREGEPVTLDPATGMTFSEAAGDYQAPDRVRADVKVMLFGNVLQIEVYWLPEGTYLSNPLTRQLVPASDGLGFDGASIFQADGMPAVLRTGIQNPQRVGTEDIEGVAAIHIRGEADGAALAALTAGTLQSGTLYPVDVWVDAAAFVPARVHVAEPGGNGWRIDFYDIDAEIEVQLP
ncbi:MAG: LppX_LprAFG lipoprotein [Anaerolineales bacterium]|nr:LppX_LprAFG lipoprotein [Anaerolineales bacterium]